MKKIAILLSLIVSICAQKGPVLEFDGTDDYVDLGNISNTNFTTADFSIQVWVKTTSTKAQSILVKGDGDGVWEPGEKALYMDSAGYPWFVGFNNEYIPGTGLKINDGQWHHIVVTWGGYTGSLDSGIPEIYVDGEKSTGDPSYMAVTGDNSEDKIYIGKAEAWEAQNNFDGGIAEVAIWGYALSAAEVLALHSAYLSANLTGDRYAITTAAYYWRLAEGSGTSATIVENPNIANGTIYGATWNTSPVIAAVSDVTINEDESSTVTLSATDTDGDALTYSTVSDTNAVTFSISSSTLTLTPNANWNGIANFRLFASDGSSWNSTSFKLTVTPVNDIATVQDVTIEEDKTAEVTLSSTFSGTTTFTAVSDNNAVSVSVSSSTLTLTPTANWNGVANIKAYASDGSSKDSTSFKITVTALNDSPEAFEWVSSPSDTIYITQSNLTDTYTLEWDASIDIDGDVINYLIYAKIGLYPIEEVEEITDTAFELVYEEILEQVFEGSPVNGATVRLNVRATDGIDTVDVTGDNIVLYVNRYDYLSVESEGIPTEFALHENYPNPFNPTTTLRFDLPEVSNITLTIFNMLGQKIRTYDMQSAAAGYHTLKWNATNDYGDPVGAGVYLYQLQSKDFVKTRKMVLLK